jgi:hypothetical protein
MLPVCFLEKKQEGVFCWEDCKTPTPTHSQGQLIFPRSIMVTVTNHLKVLLPPQQFLSFTRI